MRDTGSPVFPICHSLLTPAQGQGDVLRFHEELRGINHKRIVTTHCVDITRVPRIGNSRWLSNIPGEEYQPLAREVVRTGAYSHLCRIA